MTFGDLLYKSGIRKAIQVGWMGTSSSATGEARYSHGIFQPWNAYSGTYKLTDRYYFPYYDTIPPDFPGQPSEFKPKGPVMGPEGLTTVAMQDAFSSGASGPLNGIGLPPGYVFTQQDLDDAMYVDAGDGRSIYSAWIWPYIKPPVTTPPPPVNPPPVTPPPVTPPPTTGLSSIEQRANELMLLFGNLYNKFRSLTSFPATMVLPKWEDMASTIKPIVTALIAAKRNMENRIIHG